MWGRLGLFYAIVVSLIGAVGWFYVENAGGHEDFGYDENVGDDLKIGIVAFDLINTEVFKIVIKSDPSIGKLSECLSWLRYAWWENTKFQILGSNKWLTWVIALYPFDT